MPLITAHCSGVSARRSSHTVKGSLAVGFMRCSVCLRLEEATPMGLCGGSRRFDVEGLREGFEAEPAARKIVISAASLRSLPSVDADASTVHPRTSSRGGLRAQGAPAPARRAPRARSNFRLTKGD
jgi:hypothetical protein